MEKAMKNIYKTLNPSHTKKSYLENIDAKTITNKRKL